MKYLGEISDPKDIVTKEYVDGRSGVTGVKGNSESTYRTGNVNLTPANVGAVAKSGDTMTGVLTVKGGMYEDARNGALNMNNSDIYGLNSIYTADASDTAAEGIHFYRTATTVDSVHANSGKLYFTPNRTLGTAGTSYAVMHDGRTMSADLLWGGYLNIHPENSPIIIPFMHNDIAFLTQRGGTAVATYDGNATSYDLSPLFDGSGSYVSFSSSTYSTLVIELTCHKQFTWTSTIYIDFGSVSWRAKSVKIEVMNSNYSGDTWSTKLNTTTNALGHVNIRFGHIPVGASNSGGGFNKIRLTFTNWNGTDRRIAGIGVYNYASIGLREPFMSRGIDDPVYRSITPAAANTYDLGTASKWWRNIHGDLRGCADYAAKMQTYKANSTTETYGTSYPFYVQWRTNIDLALKCTGYSTEVNGLYPIALRPASANPSVVGGGQLRHFYASSLMTTAKPPFGDGAIIHVPWDGNNGFDMQLAMQNTSGRIAVRGMNAGTWQPWNQVYDEGHKPSLSADVTGTLPVANGGTGQTSAVNAANAFANALTTGSSDPTDADYYIAQYAGGGTSTTTYHRRPHSALWNYIKGKISSVLGLTATTYGGTATNASKVNNHTVEADVPSTAVFTDTVRNKIYTATCPTAAGTAAKVATLEEASGFSLAAGVRVAVRFQYGNTATTPTLNVNSTGAKTIAYPTSATATATGNGSTYNSWGAYETVLFTYNGTYWVKDTTGLLGYLAYNKAEDAKAVAQQAYSAIPAAGTAAILGTGTDTANRTWSAKILHDYIESGVPTTTWTAPTAISNAITVVNGGYYTSGRHCYVQMRCTLTNALSANSGIWAASGLPLPVTGTPPLTIIVNSRGGHACRVNTDGRLQIVADVDHGITAGTNIDIAGVYTIA